MATEPASATRPLEAISTSAPDLTDEQRAIVEWGDGPLVVIAGAGTGKTRVIVERVRYLLETKGEASWTKSGLPIPAEPGRHDPPFDGPLAPEQLLVLTYNVKAAKELEERLERALGPTTVSRLSVSNFHSFCHRILGEHAAEAGLDGHPDVLDGVGQLLLLRDLWPDLPLVYHSSRGGDGGWWLGQFVAFINRAKDELVTPNEVEAFAEAEQAAFEAEFGPIDAVIERLRTLGNLRPAREVRRDYGRWRAQVRAGDDVDPGDAPVYRTAEREARRTMDGGGHARAMSHFPLDEQAEIEALTETYVIDGAALEVLRFRELALVYRAYQAALHRRGALDFGEQIAAVIRLFRERPNVLRRYQRQFRYLLVDEFQDANVAQIELVELLGRSPDRPDNVMVVGDDDQSIYRFRGASYAAFAEFDRRFSEAPVHDPGAPAPGRPTRLRLEENHRSGGHVLTAANRLIDHNVMRYEAGKQLHTNRGDGEPVTLVVCAGPDDEAVAIADRIRELVGADGDAAAKRPWSDIAILYRKHRHREAIVARLRDEDIPYTVVGGLSLFDTPEIRDLEQTLRAIADPHQDVALARMLSAGPWRLDALEILAVVRMARYDRRHVIEAVREVVESGEVLDERPDEIATGGEGDEDDHADDHGMAAAGGVALQPRTFDPRADHAIVEDEAPPRTAAIEQQTGTPKPEPSRREVAPATQAKLRRVLETIDALSPLTWREGPHTILERLLERTGTVLDLIAADTHESQRGAANIASFLRFAADWQREHPTGSLGAFVDYLDAYQAAGGELPTSVELTEDVDGVRLMTLYQAKGLEFPCVFVPYLLDGEWPVGRESGEILPRELLREGVPVGDLLAEEERRLLYVALTRTQEQLVLTTHAGPDVEKHISAFVEELREGAGAELVEVESGGGVAQAANGAAGTVGTAAGSTGSVPGTASSSTTAAIRQVMPLPTAREHRLALRVRATELLGMIEGTDPEAPETADARASFGKELARVGEAAALAADQARDRGLDPLTMRVVALDSGAGANLLEVAPLPGSFSYSQFDVYERCPLQYAFKHVYRFPEPEGRGALTFGSTAHDAFERFTRERRERAARGDPPPTREDLGRWFDEAWQPGTYGSAAAEQGYRERTAPLLDAFFAGELAATDRDVLHEELPFELVLEPDDAPPVIVHGKIDRIDRLASDGIEVIDYKTGRPGRQKNVDESLQLSIYALACRETLGLGTPERVTLYYTEAATRMTTTRSDEQLDAARDDLLERAARIRAGDFAATPSAKACGWCDFRAMCPSRAE